MTHEAEADFEAAMREAMPWLLRYATGLSGDPQLGADIVQDVMIRAHGRWSTIAGYERPHLYLRRMVTNEYLSWRRRWHVRHIVSAPRDILEANADLSRDHADRLADHDDLRDRLARLPRRQRAVLVLRYYEQVEDDEIADLMGISPGTVRSMASRGLATLRRAGFGDDQPTSPGPPQALDGNSPDTPPLDWRRTTSVAHPVGDR